MKDEYRRVPKGNKLERDFDIIILDKLNPIVANKTFGTKKCRLCSLERRRLIEAEFTTGVKKLKLVNKRSELHGKCYHKPKFHMFVKGTDEGQQFCSPINERVSPSEFSERSVETGDTELSQESVEMEGDEIVLNLNMDFNEEANWADV